MFDHFKFLAPVYDRVMGGPNMDRMARLLDLPTEGRLLDMGGGTGRVVSSLTRSAGAVVVGDVSLTMVRKAREKPGLYPVRCGAEGLPFGDARFHRCLVVDALHHFRSQEAAVAELARVLVPGGRLVIEEPDIDRWIVRAVALGERLALMGSRFHPPDRIRMMMEAQGLRARIMERDPFRAWIVGVKGGDLPL